jgi:hypothetical protein
MAARPVRQDDRAQRQKSRRWFAGWRKKIEIGGYLRIQGALSNLGHRLAPNTIARILKQHGIDQPQNVAERRLGRSSWVGIGSR